MYEGENLKRIEEGKARVQQLHSDLRGRIVTRSFLSDQARAMAVYGLTRRLGGIARGIENIFKLLPPGADASPRRDELADIEIQLHAHITNSFGAMDNIAWIWTLERNIKDRNGRALHQRKVGLRKNCIEIRKSLPSAILELVNATDPWFEYLEPYRHSLAHRIPLYLPPFIVDPDVWRNISEGQYQSTSAREWLEAQAAARAVSKFHPIMAIGPGEDTRPVRFHPQVVSDFLTIAEMAEAFLNELDAPSNGN